VATCPIQNRRDEDEAKVLDRVRKTGSWTMRAEIASQVGHREASLSGSGTSLT
jgi:hypothetical protein